MAVKYSVGHYNGGFVLLHVCPTWRMYNTSRVKPNVNYSLWVMMMGPCRFIDCNKCPTLVGMLIMGEIMHMFMGNFCTFL